MNKKLVKLFGDLSVYTIIQLEDLVQALEDYIAFVKEEIKK